MSRYRVAYLCVDSDGKWSVDMPGYEQGGTVGFGTSTPLDGSYENAVALLASLPVEMQEWCEQLARDKGIIY